LSFQVFIDVLLGPSRFLGGQSRLKAGCGHNCPPYDLCGSRLSGKMVEAA
jgi:hypothetical protein